MRLRTLLLSTLTLCLLAAAAFVAERYIHAPESAGMVGKVLLPDRNLQKVSIVVLEGAEGQVTLRRKEQVWTVDEEGGRAADRAKLTALLHLLKTTRVDQHVPSRPANLATFGLLQRVENQWRFEAGRTAKVISLFYGLESRHLLLFRLLIGKTRTVRAPAGGARRVEGTYVRFPGTNQVYLVDEALPLETVAGAWLRRKEE